VHRHWLSVIGVWLLLGLCTVARPEAPAESPQGEEAFIARFNHISLDQGLSQGEIRSIAQDQRGFLWFGSARNGLNRFDGYEVRVYAHDPGNPRSLSRNFIRSSYVDRAGDLWIGTASGGLCRYGQNSDDFERFSKEPGNPQSLPHNSILGMPPAVCGLPRGAVWHAFAQPAATSK